MPQDAIPATARRPIKTIYALSGWTVEQRGARWWIVRTIDHNSVLAPHRSGPWRGPYRSLESACLVIARQLRKEAEQRHRRRCELHGLEP